MSQHRRLETDRDFEEALRRQTGVRVFRDDHIVEPRGLLVRFDERSVVLQSGVGDLTYHERSRCEFFELKPGASR